VRLIRLRRFARHAPEYRSCSDDLAIDDDRETALNESWCRDRCNTAIIDCVLKRPALLLEQRCRAGLARRRARRRQVGGIVHPPHQNWLFAVIDHRNDASVMHGTFLSLKEVRTWRVGKSRASELNAAASVRSAPSGRCTHELRGWLQMGDRIQRVDDRDMLVIIKWA
jgi:hypothetical protein